MLIEFRVENHRSLRDEQVLTMEAAALATKPIRGHDGSRAVQKVFCRLELFTARMPAGRVTY